MKQIDEKEYFKDWREIKTQKELGWKQLFS